MTGAVHSWHQASDAELAVAAAHGDRRALAEIYDRYSDRLYDFCLGTVGDREAAADCVQEVFCVAATNLTSLREPDKLRPWLYSVARNHAMRRLRERYREEVSDDLPDAASHEAGPDTMAGRSELAALVAAAAGGLSDRDREVLELTYRHGLDGPELAEALGVTLTNANTMVFRLRKTIERSLGALLVARSAHTNRQACPGLAASLAGWDGQFTVLTRKRVARHIESCPNCEREQRRRVNQVALLGGAPLFIPAPTWLRDQTFRRVQLTSASAGLGTVVIHASPHHSDATETHQAVDAATPSQDKRRMLPLIALVLGIPLSCLGLTMAWLGPFDSAVTPAVVRGTDVESTRATPTVLTTARTATPGPTPITTPLPAPVTTPKTTGALPAPSVTTTPRSTPNTTTQPTTPDTTPVTTTPWSTPVTTTPWSTPDTTTPWSTPDTTTPWSTPDTTPEATTSRTTPAPEPLPTPIPTPTPISVVPDVPVIH